TEAREEEPAPSNVVELPIEPATEAFESDENSAADEAILQAKDEIDPELLEIFSAEANDYLPSIAANLSALVQNPHDGSALADLLRALHTVKGSARMAGAMRLGALVHDMESRAELAREQASSAIFEQLLARHDDAVTMFEAMQRGEPAPLPTSLRRRLAQAASIEEAPAASEEPVVADESTSSNTPVAETLAPAQPALADSRPLAPVVPLAPVAPVFAAPEPPRAKQSALVRVRSDVLDRLVNQAGEVAIARARLENDLQGMRGALSDLSENVSRLRTQMREIEIAAEAQMQSRMEQQREAGAQFDPLEFDRFTRLQELTRMLSESVNDVSTLQQNIVRGLDGASKGLTNQARLTRDLQQDLMRVRMVPVDSVADRLYRVVRQSAKELGKRVNLEIEGSNVELDRGVLERMVGPFEHLLRNAVVHGIESIKDRVNAGKAEAGQIKLVVRQDGNEVLLEFSDDGGGLNLPRIRERGLERGLLADPDASDAQIADLIFLPGFSTAASVTELAGRGVGMDVVRSEATALGGRVEVHTEAGQGTRFRIRLPLTLAVTQVVLVRASERIYALPSVLVEQVQQLRPEKLLGAYQEGVLNVLGERVAIKYLPQLLGDEKATPIAQRYSPVVAVRSAGARVAVHVDEVVGNQEVVVKNIGPQLARMIGIAGATVLGSGDIVLILDPVQLAERVELHRPAPTHAEAAPTATQIVDLSGDAPNAPKPKPAVAMSTAPVVMVVDDSVTVRRVTQRLLAREGYQVVLAKDGVDALEQLQEFAPDVMLVDIEMPRMDGFDLTRNVRADERFRKIPIVMITSRTADKHRNHALSLGVDVYLGKPYQEDELLEHVGTLCRKQRLAPTSV
ncbi:MAG TPA: response regulator, partial [Burkholderiaceae bacterium]|nr:response regulator [Burkholderiaceae bacterium]